MGCLAPIPGRLIELRPARKNGQTRETRRWARRLAGMGKDGHNVCVQSTLLVVESRHARKQRGRGTQKGHGTGQGLDCERGGGHPQAVPIGPGYFRSGSRA